MIKKIVFVCILSVMGITSQAQELDFGLKAGVNFAELTDADDLDNRTALLAGAFVGLKFNDKFAIQPEILYSQQGGDSDFGDYHIDYINIPVIFKFYLIGDVLNVQAGPQFGFVANDDFPEFENIEDQIEAKSFDMSAAVGAGLDLPFGVRVDARYNFGVTDAIENTDAKNGVFSIAVGYSFL
ncbi:Outer membrane protein beta-barrel domain-containing protein [Mesonia phycicola]|uniref:Outer membrane protein beta-barrel domain-containing protein n=1 Tax=Mesonia phycicola TaxID=579105 RepID=A0A1M6FK47_9FLAO|nr:porin family protein [Mesonia phycicola]SHI98090.1 Outer membrane protein beta-barrel domain-containing protein [Mesonia phycicola]